MDFTFSTNIRPLRGRKNIEIGQFTELGRSNILVAEGNTMFLQELPGAICFYTPGLSSNEWIFSQLKARLNYRHASSKKHFLSVLS
jgi:hypothetical protein